VLQVGDGLDTGTFRSATVSPSLASNNSNLRLRFRVVGNGNHDNCWGDDIIVRGTPISSTLSAAKTQPDSLLLAVSDSESTALTAAASGEALEYGSPSFNLGFDPGFDHLFGDGNVERQSLSYELLVRRYAGRPVIAGLHGAGRHRARHAFKGWLNCAMVDQTCPTWMSSWCGEQPPVPVGTRYTREQCAGVNPSSMPGGSGAGGDHGFSRSACRSCWSKGHGLRACRRADFPVQ
jgi:hypothetical protein